MTTATKPAKLVKKTKSRGDARKPAKAPTPKPVVTRTTCIYLLLDESYSMFSLQDAVIRAFNSISGEIESLSREPNHIVRISLMTFTTRGHDLTPKLTVVYFDANAGLIRKIVRGTDYGQFYDRSRIGCENKMNGTPLYDAVMKAIADLRSLPNANDPNTSFLVKVLTDGHDDKSPTYNAHNLKEQIEELQRTDRWTFAFLVPPSEVEFCQRTLRLPQGNIQAWEQTSAGVENVATVSVASVGQYLRGRASGILRSTQSLYKVDLADIKSKDVQKRLVDVSKEFKSWTVDREVEIAPFIQSKGKEYKLGSTFYELSKKEEVQNHKALVVEEGKKSKRFFSGPGTRELLGLPTSGTVKIDPGNLGDRTLFVQSTSTNRKLVRGTRVLWRNV
jgi:hypothetical protein